MKAREQSVVAQSDLQARLRKEFYAREKKRYPNVVVRTVPNTRWGIINGGPAKIKLAVRWRLPKYTGQPGRRHHGIR
jgi:hypothetical protein